MRLFLLFALLVGIICTSTTETCPEVFDGLTNGHFDLSQQFSTSSLSANWNSIPGALGYEVAVVSSNLLKDKVLNGGCISNWFLGTDVKGWTNVRKDNSVTFNNLKLVPGVTYYSVVRTTLSNGAQIFSNSDGVFIVPEENKLQFSNSEKNTQKEKLSTRSEKVEPRYASHRNNLRSSHSLCDNHECDIDEENRCRKAQISVQDYLNEFYGPPRFIDNLDFELFGFVIPVFIDDDGADDDDDDGYSSAEKGGIILGVVLGALLLFLLCLCVLAVLAIILNPGEGDKPFDETIVTHKKDVVDADLSQSVQHEIGSTTRVEFPDIDPQSNLSQ